MDEAVILAVAEPRDLHPAEHGDEIGASADVERPLRKTEWSEDIDDTGNYNEQACPLHNAGENFPRPSGLEAGLDCLWHFFSF